MNTSLKTRINQILLCTPFLVGAVIFTGCEDSQLSRSPDDISHTTLKPPMIDDEESSEAIRQSVEFVGTIEEVGASSIIVSLEEGGMRTFMIMPETAFTLDGQHATVVDLAAGQSVTIEAQAKEDLLIAEAISIGNRMIESHTEEDIVRREITVEGKITSLSPEEILVTDEDGVQHRVAITAETSITLEGEEATVANLRQNQKVIVNAIESGKSTSALIVAIQQ